MTKHKHRWTYKEEQALYDGVDEYGTGKWKEILKDPRFSAILVDRSNVDLKDKWRNLHAGLNGSRSRGKVKNLTTRKTTNPPLAYPVPLAVISPIEYGGSSHIEHGGSAHIEHGGSSLIEYGGSPHIEHGGRLHIEHGGSSHIEYVGSSHIEYGGSPHIEHGGRLHIEHGGRAHIEQGGRPYIEHGGRPHIEHGGSLANKKPPPTYGEMITEALASIEDPNGLDLNAICYSIEQKYELPKNFRRKVTLKLRRLLLSGLIEKVDDCYKFKDNHNKEDAEPVGAETVEEIASTAAYWVAEAENLELAAIKGCEKADKLAELLVESIAGLRVAEEIYEQCKREGYVLVAS